MKHTTTPSTPAPHTPRFSFFDPPIRNVTPCRTVSLQEVYQAIRTGTYQKAILELRALEDKKQQQLLKASRLPYVTFCGIFSTRKDAALLEDSNLLVIDLDQVPDLPITRKRLLEESPFDTEMLFVSPSGNGLKWVLKKGPHPHLKFFHGICGYLKAAFGLEADVSGKDLSRASYLSFDPEIFLHPKHLEHPPAGNLSETRDLSSENPAPPTPKESSERTKN